MVLLLEKAKLVVEGAGAVGVAALLSGAVQPAPGSGHDRASCSAAATSTPACSPWSPAATRPRRAAGSSSSPASPTARARSRALLDCVAATGANLVEVQHVREGVDLHVRETAVQLVLETRGREHAQDAVLAMRAGYEPRGGYEAVRRLSGVT